MLSLQKIIIIIIVLIIVIYITNGQPLTKEPMSQIAQDTTRVRDMSIIQQLGHSLQIPMSQQQIPMSQIAQDTTRVRDMSIIQQLEHSLQIPMSQQQTPVTWALYQPPTPGPQWLPPGLSIPGQLPSTGLTAPSPLPS
jgi:hypothetical protein